MARAKAGGRQPSKLEQQLAALRGEPSQDEVVAALRAETGMLVEAGARHAIRLGLGDELAPAFERLCEQAAKRDPGCRGKTAIARALHDDDRWEEAVFARGATLQQLEPAYGGPVDTAGELRGICGLAYAHMGRPDALDVIAELLADRERVARIAAGQALGDAGRRDASALLRYKLLAGDAEPDVLTACFEALFRLQGDGAIELAARFLPKHDDKAELAAFALGSSRSAAARPILTAWADACTTRQRHGVAYLALALLRDEHANAQLAHVIATGDRAAALAAATALATFAADHAIADAILAAAKGRDPAVRDEIRAIVERHG